MSFLSEAKIKELKQTYEKLKSSLDQDRLMNTKSGGPMESFKEATSYAIVTQAKEMKVQELLEIIKNAKILPDNISGDSIILGKWFTISNSETNTHYRLVDPIEADPKKFLISKLSPLGLAVFNRRKGQKFVLKDQNFKIINVE